jgi:hypothetical protein
MGVDSVEVSEVEKEDMTILQLFRTGLDTKEIASRLRVSEAMVYNRMYRERLKESPNVVSAPTASPKSATVVAATHKPRQLIRYAGYDGRDR